LTVLPGWCVPVLQLSLPGDALLQARREDFTVRQAASGGQITTIAGQNCGLSRVWETSVEQFTHLDQQKLNYSYLFKWLACRYTKFIYKIYMKFFFTSWNMFLISQLCFDFWNEIHVTRYCRLLLFIVIQEKCTCIVEGLFSDMLFWKFVS